MLNAGNSAIGVAIVSGVFACIGTILQFFQSRRREMDRRRDKAAQDALAQPDAAYARLKTTYDVLDQQLKDSYARNDSLEIDLDQSRTVLANLRAEIQQLAEDYDRLVGENRQLRRDLGMTRTDIYKRDSDAGH